MEHETEIDREIIVNNVACIGNGLYEEMKAFLQQNTQLLNLIGLFQIDYTNLFGNPPIVYRRNPSLHNSDCTHIFVSASHKIGNVLYLFLRFQNSTDPLTNTLRTCVAVPMSDFLAMMLEYQNV